MSEHDDEFSGTGHLPTELEFAQAAAAIGGKLLGDAHIRELQAALEGAPYPSDVETVAAERDRCREALRSIMEHDVSPDEYGTYDAASMQEIARRALDNSPVSTAHDPAHDGR